MSDAPFSQMEEIADNFIRTAFPKALSSAYFSYAAIIVFTIGLSLLLYSVFRNKSAYISRYTTDMKLGYGLMAVSVALAVLQFVGIKGAGAVIVALLSFVCAAVGTAGVLLRRRLGVPFLVTSYWLSLPVKEMLNLPAVYKDYAEIGEYNAASKMAVYAADRMLLGRILVLMLIASALTALIVVYFTRRRYYFTAAYEQEFEGVSRCPKCLSPIVSDSDYCSACGESIKGLPASVLRWKPLESPKYCADCGNRLNNNGDCVRCDTAGTMKNHAINLFGGMTLSSAIKYLVAIVLVVVFFFVPLIKGDVLNQLVSGSAQINNAYVEKFTEWDKNPSVAENTEWLASYDEASDALFDLNARGFDINPDRLNYKNLYCYINYFEASYQQMAVLQRVNEAVHSGDTEKSPELSSYFNETIHLQEQALVLGLQLNVPFLKTAENAVLDSGRYYLSFIPWGVTAAVLLIIGLIGIAGAVILLLRTSGDTFKTKAVLGIPEGEKAAIEQKYKAVIKKERLTAAIGVVAALLIIGIVMTVSTVKNSAAPPTYESCLHTVYTENGSELLVWLSECRTNPEQAKADSKEIKKMLDDSIEKLDLIINDPEAESEVVSVSKELLESLNSLKQCLDSDTLPDNGLITRVTEQLKNGMSIDTERLLNDALESLGELF